MEPSIRGSGARPDGSKVDGDSSEKLDSGSSRCGCLISPVEGLIGT